jgi:hypothetical protein
MRIRNRLGPPPPPPPPTATPTPGPPSPPPPPPLGPTTRLWNRRPLVIAGFVLLGLIGLWTGEGFVDEADGEPLREIDLLEAPLESVVLGEQSGQAVFVPTEAGTQISISLSGLAEGRHAAFIQHGNCNSHGEVHVTLEEVVADELGNGESSTFIADPDFLHFREVHYIAVYQFGIDVIGGLASCGVIAPVEP